MNSGRWITITTNRILEILVADLLPSDVVVVTTGILVPEPVPVDTLGTLPSCTKAYIA